jgi:hypothetical protein
MFDSQTIPASIALQRVTKTATLKNDGIYGDFSTVKRT